MRAAAAAPTAAASARPLFVQPGEARDRAGGGQRCRCAPRIRPGRSPPRRGRPRLLRGAAPRSTRRPRRSPSDPARRSIGARASTTSRRVASGRLCRLGRSGRRSSSRGAGRRRSRRDSSRWNRVPAVKEVAFFAGAIGALGGAIAVISLRNAFYSVLALIVHLISLAGPLPPPPGRIHRRRPDRRVRGRRDGPLRLRRGLRGQHRRAALGADTRTEVPRPAARNRALHRARHRHRRLGTEVAGVGGPPPSASASARRRRSAA